MLFASDAKRLKGQNKKETKVTKQKKRKLKNNKKEITATREGVRCLIRFV